MSAEKRWVLKEQGEPAKVARLATALEIPPVLANLLVQRGIETEEEAWQFFNPKLENLHDPFLMKDMRKAVERVDLALSRGESIMVYGDYDVDGTTAVALVYSFLRRLGHKALMFYIPDRYTEGYGVSYKAIDHAQRKGVGVIITLDCGIKATEKVAYAKERGIDMIICDHHLPGEKIPEAVAVLDPKRADCPYPFKELSGCGVGFKMLQGYCLYKGLPFSEVECLLDLVVVSIASDIVPLVGENRILAYYGLKRLNEKPGKGLQSIIKICGLEKHAITIDDIVFKIGPRINAAGRMEVDAEGENAAPSGGHSAVYLMVARDEEVATEYGAFIDRSNQDRKNIDRSVTQEAHDFIEHHPQMKELKSTVIYNPQWMKGIVGIVASRLIETYYRPTVVLTMSNGFVTGSARSVPGFDLYQAVESCADLLENFGGHMYDDEARKRRDVHEALQRLCRGAHRSGNAYPAGRYRFGTALQRYHAPFPRDAGPFPAFRPGQYRAGIRHTECEQPGRCAAGRCRTGTPQDGSDSGTKAQYGDPGHCVPAAETL